jgi:2-C-methyl-D-erythritol 4-phosphate cytidylyltransferase
MTYAIILAAGFGSRFVKQPIKPLFVINKKPIFLHSVLTFLKNKNIDKILLVVNKDYENLYKKYLSKNILTCHGDKSFRYQSLINGVSFLEKKYSLNKNDIIITHDAARINVDNEIINQNITISKKYGYATTILPINDSICEINKISKYIDRNNKYLVQTPQTIQYKY